MPLRRPAWRGNGGIYVLQRRKGKFGTGRRKGVDEAADV